MSDYLNLKPVDFDALSAKAQTKVSWLGRILLPKYDGCFAMVLFMDGKPHAILSRTGEKVVSMDHIYDDLLLTYPALANTKGGYAILGEAWNPGKEFKTLSGEFRRQYAQPQLGFAPFDLVRWAPGGGAGPELYSPHSYVQRLALLQDARPVITKIFPPPAVNTLCQDAGHAERYAKVLKDAGGYDGAIASDPAAGYMPGSGKCGSFLKVKPLLRYTLEVVGYEAGTGEKTGRATGAAIVRFKHGTCKVGTGFSETEQANLQDFVGKLIDVDCMGVYAGDTGKMREPRYVGIRTDVTQPDY